MQIEGDARKIKLISWWRQTVNVWCVQVSVNFLCACECEFNFKVKKSLEKKFPNWERERKKKKNTKHDGVDMVTWLVAVKKTSSFTASSFARGYLLWKWQWRWRRRWRYLLLWRMRQCRFYFSIVIWYIHFFLHPFCKLDTLLHGIRVQFYLYT